jgi:hypothetical protein
MRVQLREEEGASSRPCPPPQLQNTTARCRFPAAAAACCLPAGEFKLSKVKKVPQSTARPSNFITQLAAVLLFCCCCCCFWLLPAACRQFQAQQGEEGACT